MARWELAIAVVSNTDARELLSSTTLKNRQLDLYPTLAIINVISGPNVVSFTPGNICGYRCLFKHRLRFQ
jgi:hypothetical protein